MCYCMPMWRNGYQNRRSRDEGDEDDDELKQLKYLAAFYQFETFEGYCPVVVVDFTIAGMSFPSLTIVRKTSIQSEIANTIAPTIRVDPNDDVIVTLSPGSESGAVSATITTRPRTDVDDPWQSLVDVSTELSSAISSNTANLASALATAIGVEETSITVTSRVDKGDRETFRI